MMECLDEEGVSRPDLAAASKHALVAAYSLMAADMLEGQLHLDHRIDVEDDAGNIVHTVYFGDLATITGQECS